MAETIKIPQEDNNEITPVVQESPIYFTVSRYFDELNHAEVESEVAKSLARENLGVLSLEELVENPDFIKTLTDIVKKQLTSDLDGLDALTKEEYNADKLNFVKKNDTDIRFEVPIVAGEASAGNHLITKQQVENLLRFYLKGDQKTVESWIATALVNYIEKSEVYTKTQVDTIKESILNSIKSDTTIVRTNGSHPFTGNISGKDPLNSRHLANKGYVDKIMINHKGEADPHNFIETLNRKLKDYALNSNVLDRTQTYTRSQIDSKIDGLVRESVEHALRTHTDLEDPHGILEHIKELIKNPTSPQKGLDAQKDDELVTLRQVNEKINSLQLESPEEPLWVTSGNPLVTVGLIEEGSLLPPTMTLQQAMDAIFYGRKTTLNTPELVDVGKTIDAELCIDGYIDNIDYIEIYQNGELIRELYKEDFADSSCVIIDSNPIDSDTTITAKIYYIDGNVYEISSTTKVAYPVFVGYVPKFRFGWTFTYKLLKDLVDNDPKNNQFYTKGQNLQSIEHTYDFDEDQEQQLVVALPETYSDLYQLSNESQVAYNFETITNIPFKVPGSSTDVIYKLFFYKQELFSLSSTINFKFQ